MNNEDRFSSEGYGLSSRKVRFIYLQVYKMLHMMVEFGYRNVLYNWLHVDKNLPDFIYVPKLILHNQSHASVQHTAYRPSNFPNYL